MNRVTKEYANRKHAYARRHDSAAKNRQKGRHAYAKRQWIEPQMNRQTGNHAYAKRKPHDTQKVDIHISSNNSTQYTFVCTLVLFFSFIYFSVFGPAYTGWQILERPGFTHGPLTGIGVVFN